MNIAPTLLKELPAPNDAQPSIVGHGEGPLLMIARPGSGKTFSLVPRTMNLLLLGEAGKKSAFSPVMSYFRQNREEMKRVVEAEVDVSVEKEG